MQDKVVCCFVSLCYCKKTLSCILKNSTKVQVSDFKPKSVFIHTGHINYRSYQMYIHNCLVLENHLYMMLSERKYDFLSAAGFESTQINQLQRGVCSFKIILMQYFVDGWNNLFLF